jgi:hypothetical protein
VPAYSHNVSLDLYEQIGFSRVSSSVKRLLVARWVNQGKGPMDVPALSTSDQSRFMKISSEEGFEVLQEVLLLADDAERHLTGY